MAGKLRPSPETSRGANVGNVFLQESCRPISKCNRNPNDLDSQTVTVWKSTKLPSKHALRLLEVAPSSSVPQ